VPLQADVTREDKGEVDNVPRGWGGERKIIREQEEGLTGEILFDRGKLSHWLLR
jgi:hypothetical protein